ncbi:MAG: nucleotide sugar dehydrogenase [Pseudomonadota bacterium]
MSDLRVSVVGLGYVGLPVAVAFARAGVPVVGFDVSDQRVAELLQGNDRTREVAPEDLAHSTLTVTGDPARLDEANFHIVTVPTPIDDANRPDLSPLISASRMLAPHLGRGDIVVYESTVYPGATEEVCIPVLEEVSGLTFGTDFTIGYSPERINPGDKDNRFETIVKVVAGSDARTADIVEAAYATVVTAGVHRAPTIQVAEAAKVLENTQRDLNIALINEMALIYDRLDIDTRDVLAAAGTKWNFLPFKPGLVGGHCIGVDPYYMAYRAEQVAYHPEVLLAGRRVNNSMGKYIANRIVRNMMRRGWDGMPKVAILGATFKPDVTDIRNTRVVDIALELGNFGIEVQIADPMADPAEFKREYGSDLVAADALDPADAVVLAVGHRAYRDGGWPLVTGLLRGKAPIVADVQDVLDRAATPDHVTLWRL